MSFFGMTGVQFVVTLAFCIPTAIFFGPVALPLPGLPHIKIVDLHADLHAKPSVEMTGVFAPNNALHSATVLFNNTVASSESVFVEQDGSLVLLDKYGAMLTAHPNASAPGGYTLNPDPVTWLGPSRPLGFKRDAHGNLIVCNTALGLVMVEAGTNRVVLLGQRVSDSSPLDPGTPILYANTLDISVEGIVYFSDSQRVPVTPNYMNSASHKPWYDTFGSFMAGVYSGQATGRLMAYYPNNGSIHVLAKGFRFSNGVALSADESFLVLAETAMLRLLKYTLKGPEAGRLQVFTDLLPGFPDGVTRSRDGNFWVALPSPRTPMLDMLNLRVVRTIMAYLPPSLRPPIPTWGAVIKVNAKTGDVMQFLGDMTGSHVSFISAVDEEAREDGQTRLWLGNVNKHYIAYIDV